MWGKYVLSKWWRTRRNGKGIWQRGPLLISSTDLKLPWNATRDRRTKGGFIHGRPPCRDARCTALVFCFLIIGAQTVVTSYAIDLRSAVTLMRVRSVSQPPPPLSRARRRWIRSCSGVCRYSEIDDLLAPSAVPSFSADRTFLRHPQQHLGTRADLSLLAVTVRFTVILEQRVENTILARALVAWIAGRDRSSFHARSTGEAGLFRFFLRLH